MTHLTHTQLSSLQIIVATSATLSVLATAAVCVSALRHRQYHSLALRLLFLLLLCSFALSACVLAVALVPISQYTNPQYATLCTVSDGFIQFFLFASLTWIGSIVHMLSSVLVTRARVERFSPFYHIFSFGISLLGAALAVVLSLYAPSSSDPTDSTSNTGGKNTTVPLDDEHGRGGIWCWVESRDAPIFRFVLIYGPLLLLTLFCACCYLFTVRMLNTQAGHHRLTCSSFLCYRSGEENREATPIIRSMRIFIAILVFCWSWGLARDIQQLIDPEHPVFWLDCLHAFFAPLQGLLLSLLYLLHGNSWQQICCRCFVSEPDVILATSKIDHAQWVEDEYNRSPSPSYVRRGPGLHTVYDSSASDVGATARPEEEHTALVGAGPSRHRFASYNGEDFLLGQS